MSGIKRFFPIDKDKTSPQKRRVVGTGADVPQPSQPPRAVQMPTEEEIVDLLDSSEGEEDFKVEEKKAPAKRAPQRAGTGTTKAQQPKPDPMPKLELKSEPPQRKPKSQAGAASKAAQPGQAAQVSAASVLASIPSADLPDIEPGAKPNLRQVIDRQAGSQDSGLQVEAAPNCLLGLTFVVTGQLPTLGREEVQGLIKRYGGHVTSSLSGKTSCMVLGEDAGPSKVQKARSLKLKVIDEAGFLQLLRAMPADGGSGRQAELARAKRARDDERAADEAKRLMKDSKPASTPKAPSTRGGKGDTGGTGGTGVYGAADSALWTSKYAPKELKDICGNNAAVQRLTKWLQNWRAARGGAKSEGSEFRAAMLSGPPGIGKTTAAHLAGRLQGFDVVEYNASDTRSKSLLHSQVSQTLSNTSLSLSNSSRKLMVIMDEVDGMSAGDRGGVGAMAALARTTNVPLVLICNERTLPKMRPFDRVVFDLPFRRPDAGQIRHRLSAIAAAEGLKLDSSAVDQLVSTTRSDIRQILNLLETYRTTKSEMSYDGSREFSSTWNKELVLKPFDIVGRLLSRGSQSAMSTSERMELYFHDYDFAPLMIQENYLTTSPNLKASVAAAESISDGDLVDRLIHGPQQQWSLMPLHALTSSVRPAFAAAGQARGRFNFTAYLGNNSKGMKYRRLLAELRSHMRLRLPANALDLRLEFQPLLAELLLRPLVKRGADAVQGIIEFMDNYFITREDWDVIMELGVGPNNSEQSAKKVPTAVKTAFTRKYNAMSHPLPFMKTVDSKAAAVTGRKQPDNEEVIAEDVEQPEEEQKEDDLESELKNDKYIKAKPKPRAKAAPKATKAKAKASSRAK